MFDFFALIIAWFNQFSQAEGKEQPVRSSAAMWGT
jgi:hypothetical protein